MEESFEEYKNHKKSKKKHLRVTFEDGKSICYTSTTMTFMETLRRIGIDKLKKLQLEVAHVPLVSDTLYPQYEEYQKELVRGWYVMTQSDNEQKYRQLLVIKRELDMDITVELGEDFETDKVQMFQKNKKASGGLLVKFPDSEYIGGTNPIDTYMDTLKKIGIDELKKKHIELGGKPLISHTDVTKAYTEIEPGTWLAIPSTTKEKAKYLKVIGAFMHIQLEVSIID